MKPRHRLLALATSGFALLLAGCGSETGELTGSVRYKGKAVVAGTVTVYDAENRPFQGAIEQGKYTVTGITPGAVQVAVVSPNPNQGMYPKGTPARPGREARPTAAAPVAGWFALPKKYEGAETSPLKTDVKAGSNPYDIELKD
jgi:hypothetical protein